MLQIWALDGIREITPGDDLVGVILDAIGEPLRDGADRSLRDGDIVVVTSKIVSKAEGRIIEAADREEAITRETVRLVASRTSPTGHVTRIVENPLGIVSAAAGVDASNTPEGTVLLLPVDPDASARALATGLRTATGAHVGVIITDTLGRAWREGQTDHAIGAGGIHVFEDLRGTVDAEGRPLVVTLPCVADEIAAATDLVKGKASRRPVAIVRGRADLVGDLDLPGARSIVRDPARDMFRQGADEAYAEGLAAGRAAGA
ncbi:coenzyme F420-0:L-glutamate ligase / coenzyme F420-1:gamma-L-glutamate ligase [Microbacterium sp. ru370.1]|uniref:coenzyme F420-0:L-glutamate ligase n=1 Tax=unclassified Microbacterium TaxID=2609290 RepID=UPI00088DE14B|nr:MULTISPECIES: coenzyme F420-0:L-glutamate ligase [unclassified Microbacterium]SDO27805.1 coenzyme F420-0:L-glutamate ligase / coenzyme F420-1:gamma-L-glutamate ligase [Microbacterium sp. ru370.1]SIT74922.1 coenzyme F420-0:L-glutamate ligase / coenzyme F420-1:gamma-L-glutamate ligase [Microbacterium sp. RU1D]